MRRIVTFFAGLTVAILTYGQAHAAVISLSSSALIPPIASGSTAQVLENELNTHVFSPLGMDFEFAAPTGGGTAVDDAAFEGPGLTVIGGSGFILRFGTAVSEVRLRVNNFKDDFNRSLAAFDFAADYVRSTTNFSQSANGNVTANPDAGLAIDFVTATLPSGNSDFLDLIVSGASNIFAIQARSDKFLWNVTEIEVTTSSVNPIPVPAALPLFLSGLLGLGIMARRRKKISA